MRRFAIAPIREVLPGLFPKPHVFREQWFPPAADFTVTDPVLGEFLAFFGERLIVDLDAFAAATPVVNTNLAFALAFMLWRAVHREDFGRDTFCGDLFNPRFFPSAGILSSSTPRHTRTPFEKCPRNSKKSKKTNPFSRQSNDRT